jgi:hypothetical protein
MSREVGEGEIEVVWGMECGKGEEVGWEGNLITSLLLTVFLIVLQVCPNFKVETVSSLMEIVSLKGRGDTKNRTHRCIGAGVTVQRILVMVLPPNDCFKIRVSFESL